MVEINPTAKYHRTLGTQWGRRDPFLTRDSYEAYLSAPTAYTFKGEVLVQIKYFKYKDRDFKKYATAWEILHSKVPYGEGSGVAFLVLDEDGLVIGHYGTFGSHEIFVPGYFRGELKTVEYPVRGIYGGPR